MAEAGSGDADSGSMLAVKAPIDELEALTKAEFPQLVLANRNSPSQGVLSGPTKAVKAAAEACKKAGYRSIMLPVGAAFHSKMIESALAPFSRALSGIDITPSDVPVFANTTAERYPEEPGKAADILSQQLAKPVNFLNQYTL